MSRQSMSSENQRTKTRIVEHGKDPTGVHGYRERDVGDRTNG